MPPPRSDYEGVVVLGVSRSGTTLMRRLLDAHPDIAAPAETYALSAAAKFLEARQLGSGAEFGALRGLHLAGFEEDDVVGRLRDFAFSFHRDYARRAGKPLWAEKTATDIFHLDGVERLCGNRVRYVVMLRDGLDVAPSLLELVDEVGGYFEELHRFAREEHRPLVAMGNAWQAATLAGLDLARRRPDAALVIRYEALVRDPSATLDALAGFLDVERPDDWAKAALRAPSSAGFGDWKTWETRALHTQSVGRHRRLPKAALAQLVDAIGPTLELAGYERPNVDRHRGEGGRKRAERAMQLAVLRAEPQD